MLNSDLVARFYLAVLIRQRRTHNESLTSSLCRACILLSWKCSNRLTISNHCIPNMHLFSNTETGKMFKANRYSLRENVRATKNTHGTNGGRRALGDISNNTNSSGVQNVTKKFSDLSANSNKRPSPPVTNRANGTSRPASLNRVSQKQNWVDIMLLTRTIHKHVLHTSTISMTIFSIQKESLDPHQTTSPSKPTLTKRCDLY